MFFSHYINYCLPSFLCCGVFWKCCRNMIIKQVHFDIIILFILSADNIRPYISGWRGGSNYINAVYVDVSNVTLTQYKHGFIC